MLTNYKLRRLSASATACSSNYIRPGSDVTFVLHALLAAALVLLTIPVLSLVENKSMGARLLNKYYGDSGKALKKMQCLPLKLWIKEADPTKCWLRFTADKDNVQTLRRAVFFGMRARGRRAPCPLAPPLVVIDLILYQYGKGFYMVVRLIYSPAAFCINVCIYSARR